MSAKFIASAANETFRDLQELLGAKGIKKQGRALLSGNKLVPEMLRDHADQVEGIIYNDPASPALPGSEALWRLDLAKPLFQELDVAGTHAPILVVRVPAMTSWDAAQPLPRGCTLFLPFQNPENIGGVIRTAVGLGVAQIVLLGEAAHPFLPKASRAAGTSLFKIPMFVGPRMAELREIPGQVCALDMHGVDVARYKFADRVALLAGIEGQGVQAYGGRFDAISIPMRAGVESLNAAAATAIALYVWRQNSGMC